MANTECSTSWFVVFNNPEQHGYSGTPQEICERLKEEWIENSSTRTGAWIYCISKEGLHHVHMVLEDTKTMRFSKVKKTYAPGAHLEPTKGTKAQVEAYISKLPPFDEKGEKIIYEVRYGEIIGRQGKRPDLENIQEMLDAGKTPREIRRADLKFYKYEKMIRTAYMDKRRDATPLAREVRVHYRVGESGTGKTRIYLTLCQRMGASHVYLVSDYSSGGFDMYEGEEVLILDEYRGQCPYSQFLQLLDIYTIQIHARFANVWSLWTEVYITSPLPPEDIYRCMVSDSMRARDSYQQMVRRISDITYCSKGSEGQLLEYTIPMSEYTTLDALRQEAQHSIQPS